MATPPSSTKASSTVPARTRALGRAQLVAERAQGGGAGRLDHRGGTWSGRSAAGVPARREYGKACIFAKRQARASSSVSWNSASVSPGNPAMTSVDSASPGHGGVQALHERAEPVGVVGARHLAQHLRASRLQRQVEMAADAAVGGGEQVRRARRPRRAARCSRCGSAPGNSPGACRSAVASSRRRSRPARRVADGSRLAAVAVRSQVDAREHDLARAGAGVLRALAHDVVGGAARRAAARHVHDAVRARVVAAVLHLDPHAGAEARADGKERRRGGNAFRIAPRLDLLGEPGLPHHAHAGIERLVERRVDGRGAAGDEHAGAVVRAQGAAHGLAGLLLGLAGDGAGVHHDEVGVRLRRLGAAGGQARRGVVRLHAVHLAAQVDDGEVHSAPALARRSSS